MSLHLPSCVAIGRLTARVFDMSHFYVETLGILFVLWAVFVQIRNWLLWRALKRWGDQYGCKSAPAVPNKLPGGVERLYLLFTGIKSKVSPLASCP